MRGMGGGTKPEVAAKIEMIGEPVGANGGDKRMCTVAYRVDVLSPRGAVAS